MNYKHLFLVTIATVAVALYGCGGGSEQKPEQGTAPESMVADAPTTVSDKGIGKFQNVELTHPLDETLVAKGQNVYDVKCQSCHKLTDEKVVGPGWAGVTDRRTPEWIMNFVTNVDEMLNKDPEAQAMLEICMVRMPNQNLSDEEARAVLEFMRKNDNKN